MNYYALVDNSTKGTNGTKYGQSSIAWALWNEIPKLNTPPIRASIFYIQREGPNKSFFEGIVKILELIVWEDFINTRDTLIILGDCELVIDILNESKGCNQLRPYFFRVKDLERFIPIVVKYRYISESKAIYRNIDQLAKNGGYWMLNQLKKKG